MISYFNKTKCFCTGNPYRQLVYCILLLTFITIGCSTMGAPIPTPTVATAAILPIEETETNTPTKDIIATTTPTTQATSNAPTSEPPPTTEKIILPRPLYFGAGTAINRLETDGTTITTIVPATDTPIDHWQLATDGQDLYYQTGEKIIRVNTTSRATTEIILDAMPLQLRTFYLTNLNDGFDLSPNNNTLVYVNNKNQLIVTDPLGEDKAIWASGEPIPPFLQTGNEEDMPGYPGYTRWEFEQQIYSPQWSPTGELVAFGQGGVHILAGTGAPPRHIISNNTYQYEYEFEHENQPTSYLGTIVKPRSWSPDGSSLLLQEEALTADISEYHLFIDDVQNETVAKVTLPKREIPISAGTTIGYLDLWGHDSSHVYIWSFGNLLYGDTVFLRYNTQSDDPAALLTGSKNVTDAPFATDSGQLYLFVDSQTESFWPSEPKFYTLYQTRSEFLDTGDVTALIKLRDDVVSFEYEPGNYAWTPDGSGIALRQLTYGEKDPEHPIWPVTSSEWLWLPTNNSQEVVQLPLPSETLQLAWGNQ